MRSLLYKLLAYPAALSAVDWLLPEVAFSSWQQTLLVGASLALMVHLLDLALIHTVRPFRLAWVDGGVVALALITIGFWLAGLQMHAGGALLSGFLIGLVSYAIHIDFAVTYGVHD